jgi:hypothetical protein
MYNRVKTLSSLSRINHLRYGRLPSRCGRETCNCLIRLDLKDKKDKKLYNNCYDGWYKYTMRNMVEIN